MLNKLRNRKTAKKIWIVLAILIVPAFVFWGIGSVGSGKEKALYAGQISGRRIEFTDYNDALNAVTNLAIVQFGDSLPELKKQMNLQGQAWDRLILLAEAKKQRFSANDKEVVQAIQNYPFFQQKGQFSEKLYAELLQYVFHALPRVFEEQTRGNIILSKLYNAVTSAITVSDEEVKKEYEEANEQISLYYLAGIAADFAKEINPGEKETADYFAKNPLAFKQPLSFNMEYVTLDAQNQSEEQLQGEIKKILLRAAKNEALSDIAKDMGLAIKETGLFSETDPIPGIGWAPQVTNLLAKAKIGDFLPPLRMDKTYYVVRLKEMKAPYIPEFETIKDKVKEALIKDASRAIAKEKIETALQKLNANPQSADFDKIANELGLKSASTAPFTYGSYIEGIGASDMFWTKAKKLKEGSVSDLIETPAGFYIIKIKSKVAVDEKKFAEEKAKLTQQLLTQKKDEYFAQFIQALRAKAKMNN